MAALVLDASAVMAGFLPDERGIADTDLLRDVATGAAIVPAHWPLEIAQALLAAQRRKRISVESRTAILRDLTLLPVAIDPETPDHAWRQTLDLAETQALSLYDVAYLELAIRKGLPLATRDRILAAAAARCGARLR
ncbi:MAG: type II toxin-antitoxin system VapC family toxin [Alphaproteobacteria bacterium]|nr:type II toxin-antitoxin system VapC family toxin [Alphaproteobacteria bacterium]